MKNNGEFDLRKAFPDTPRICRNAIIRATETIMEEKNKNKGRCLKNSLVVLITLIFCAVLIAFLYKERVGRKLF